MPPPPPPTNIVPIKKEKPVETPKVEELPEIKGIPLVGKVTAKKPTKEYIYVREAIGQFDVYQALRLSTSVFKELFGVDYPSSRDFVVGQQISQVVFEGHELNLIWGQDLSQSSNSFSANFVMTNSTFALWELLCNNGFELKDSRNYNTYRSKESRFDGRKLCERVFERDLSK